MDMESGVDLVLARQQRRKISHVEKVTDLAEACLKELASSQDRAGAFSESCLHTLRGSGLLSIEIGTHDPSISDRPCGLKNGTFQDTVQTIRALSRVDPAVGVLVHVHNALVVRLVQQFGTAAQHARWFPALATGTIGAFAITEPQAGSDLRDLGTRATRDGDGFRITGDKQWITNAYEAGLFIVFAAVDSGATAAFLVDSNSPGVQVGARIDKMSVRASSTCPVRFDGVRVGEEDLLGGSNMGMDVAMYGLVCGRIGIAAQMLGLAEAARDLALAYARERQAFGSAILKHQGVSFPLAQVDTEITAVELMVNHAAEMVDLRHPHLKIASLANKAKLFASQVAERAVSVGVETLGGNGIAVDRRMEKLYRDAKVGKIYEGTANILLRSIAGGLMS
jgi:alkylation response protein AidB-like acyl-CoA dehydrogenase